MHNYDAALKALVRRLITGMKNNQSSRIYAHDESGFHLWADYAVYAATYLCSLDDKVKSMAFPSGDFAVREAATKSKKKRKIWNRIKSKSTRKSTNHFAVPPPVAERAGCGSARCRRGFPTPRSQSSSGRS